MHHGDEVLQCTSYFGVCPETNGFGAAPHGIIERREETFGRWKNDGGVPEFSNKRLEFLQGDRLSPKHGVCFLDVRRRLCWGKMHCSFYPVEDKANHLLL